MRKYKLIYVLSIVFISSLVMTGCKDIIEEDISGKTVFINAPTNNMTSSVYAQLFWWNEVSGALNYNIQIASPSFDSVVTIIDTTVTGLKYTKTLTPGKYQWRIRAQNGNYKTQFQTYNLTIITGPLSGQTMVLTSPANNVYQKTASFSFAWDKIYGATKYVIQIDSVAGNFSSSSAKTDSISLNSYSYSLPAEGSYMWRVMAKDNSGNSTSWSDILYTGYYSSKPPMPVASAPANNASNVASPVSFSWSASTRAASYNLYVYATGDTTKTPTLYSLTGTSKSALISGTSQVVYWRISSVDKAGNESNLTIPARTFTTQ